MPAVNTRSEPMLHAAGPLAPGPADARRGGWAGALRRWWRRQTTFLLEDAVGAAGPRRILGMVWPLLSPLLLVPAVLVVWEPENAGARIALLCGSVALVYAALAEWVERRVENPFWVQLGTVAFYAALISVLLWAFVVVEHPRPHTHWIVFFLYFLLIGVNGLSDNPRLPVCAGVFSVAGYLALIPLVERAAASGASPMAERVVPDFEWVANAAKVALLVIATLMGTASAQRGLAVRRTSLRDGLTGLLNRHAFDECLAFLARRAQRRQLPMTIAMLDIDHFKELNDNHGHATGDAVLRWVGSWLLRSFRTTDLVARFGGEEFVVAFLDAQCDRVGGRLESLREGIELTTLRTLDPEHEIRVTVSIGVASFPVDGDHVERVLALADSRLYEAKATGRNRIVGSPAPA